MEEAGILRSLASDCQPGSSTAWTEGNTWSGNLSETTEEQVHQEREEALAKALEATALMTDRVFADRDTIGIYEFWPGLPRGNL